MENNNITVEQYIEHEVKLRVIKEVNDERFLKVDERFLKVDEEFKKIDQRFDKLESKFESGFLMLIGLVITSIILPVVLHSLKLV
jgi:hypothetical protein